MCDETRDEPSVRKEAAQQGCRHQAEPCRDREVASPMSRLIYLLNRRLLHLQRSSKRSNVEYFLEVSLFFETCPLTSSELRIDEYELWAYGLGQQTNLFEISRLEGRLLGARLA
jgi:hypothetical protein